jgi:lysophospholipase L1-like esterase
VIVMLGTNDFQSMHRHTAWHSGEGMRAIVRAIRRAPIEPDMPVPAIFVVAPPAVRSPQGPIAPKFVGADEPTAGLAAVYACVADEERCRFFDAGTVTPSSAVDGVHLDAEQHAVLGHALAGVVATAL